MEFLCLFHGCHCQLLVVFSKCRGLEISYFRRKTAVYIKIRCLGSADGPKSAINFRRKPAISIKVRCLVSAKGSKSAIRMENSCLYQNQVFRKCRGLEISYLDGKQSFISPLTCELLTLTTIRGKHYDKHYTPLPPLYSNIYDSRPWL